MYKSKAKVDQQVSIILSKVRDDNEKRLKGFQLGNLYFQAKDYEQAKKYVTLFLTVKEQYAPAHKLLAQILERGTTQDDIRKSINCYKRSFELDDSQILLTVKICSLYLRLEIAPEQSSAVMYWVEKCETSYPNEPVVFNLQEKLINLSLTLTDETQIDGTLGSMTMEELLINSLKVRPLEVNVRLKLLKCLEKSQKLDTAFHFIAEVLERSPYSENFDWYNYTSELLKYVTKQADEEEWAVYLLCCLGAARTAIKFIPEQVAVDTLKRLDSVLHSSQTAPLVSYVRDELRSQLLLLAANLLSHRNADQSHTAALYLAAFSQTAESADSARGREDKHRYLYALVDKLRAHRLTQAGYVVLSCAPTSDQLNWLRKLSQKFYNKDGKRKLYSLIFGVADTDTARGESLFLSEPSLEQIQAALPNTEGLTEQSETAQALYADSLHHQTWLALRQTDNSLPDYILELIPRLNFSPPRLTQYESESVSLTDLAVFLTLTAYSAKSRLEEHQADGGAVRVSDLTAALCSEEQAQWWSAVYEACGGQTSGSAGFLRFGKQRQLLSRGLHVVRLAESHGLSVQMVCHVARLLTSKLGEVNVHHAPTSSRVIHLTYWVKLYWTEAIRMLSALHRNESLPQTRKKLFMSYNEELKPEEIQSLLAEGRLWLAMQLCEEDREDEALQELNSLPHPLASYTAAQVYRSRADLCVDSDEEGRRLLLLRSQENLYLTVDRLAADKSNPLNVAVERELETLEGELDSAGSSFLTANDSVVGNGQNGNGLMISTPVPTTRNSRRGTPANGHRSRITNQSALSMADLSPSVRVRPSPERLELQVRTIANAQESLHATIHEERNIAMETSKQMVDSVSQILNSKLGEMASVNRQLSEDMRLVQRDLADIKVTQHQMRSELTEMKAQISEVGRTPPAAAANVAGSSETQINLLQQQNSALTAMMASSLQIPPMPMGLTAFRTPARGTQPVFQPGLLEAMQLGTYPHIQQQQSTPSRMSGTPATGGGGGLTQQEMEAAALAAAEHGYDHREFYVDDGENYYGEEYGDDDGTGGYVYTEGYVGAEGGNTIAYMPKTSASGKAMPQPGFFAQPEKSQIKPAEPKPAEQGVPPNVVMNKEMMSKESAKQKPAPYTPNPLVVNVPITSAAASSTPTDAASGRSKAVPPSPSKSESGELDNSHDPHFDPIIELPPEVAVVTGEEDENVLFEGRARLFRFVKEEWKERGIGPVKLLEQKNTPGKYRLVMRRDQVHKVCANHAIHEAMSLAAMGDKAWIWSATDYAEGEPLNERFAIRFKTAEIGADFRKAFDEAREKAGNAAASSSQPIVAQPSDSQPSDTQLIDSQPSVRGVSPTSSGQQTLSDLFKPQGAQWKCDGCLCSIDVEITKCPACVGLQPGATDTGPGPSTAPSIQPPSSTGFGNLTSFKFPPTTTTPGVVPPVSAPLFGGKPITFGATSIAPTGKNVFGSGVFGTGKPSDFTPSDSATTSGTATPSEETAPRTVTATGTTSSLFGAKAVDTVPAQPSGLFSNFVKPAKQETEGSSSLLRQLLSTDASPAAKQETEGSSSLLRELLSTDASPAPAKPTEKSSMGGFTFTDPPTSGASAKPPASEPAATKAPLFAGFTGFSKPTATSTPSMGFGFSATTTSGSASSPLVFQPPAPSAGGSFAKASFMGFNPPPAQNLSALKPDMKQSNSAPQLSGKEAAVSSTSVSTDVSATKSPTKGSDNPEEECSAEFAPVIDLPELVETSTGEEDEEKLFGERCKLFRMVDGQWKERGTGELKILCHKTTNAVRLVMRREQVLKLCANHKLVSGMKLAPSGDKARMWAAQDFSENALKSETLCARFKTADLAQEFEDVFTEAVEMETSDGGDQTENSTAPAPQNSQPAQTGSLSELFKPKDGEWSCSTCTVKNKSGVNKCVCCSTTKPGAALQKLTSEVPSGAAVGFAGLKFPGFGAGGSSAAAGGVPASTPLDLSKLSFGGVKIGQTASQLNDLNQSPSNQAAAESSKSRQSVPESPGKYVEEEGEGDHIHFEPVIDLPDLVEERTGEEDEAVLYIHRAKLFRFTSGEFKERGLGDVKILKHNTTGKVRLILRREKILKLACNHLITPDMTLRPMESAAGKAWIWYAVDFSEGTQSEEMYAIRFKTAEIAAEFEACFNAAKNNETVPEQTLKTVTAETPKKSRSRPPSESQSAISVSSPAKPVSSASPAVPAAAGSIFGTPSNSASAQSSLFGATAAPSARLLFGGATIAQPASGSLFGNTSSGQSPATSVFGSIPAGQPQGGTSQSPAAALFGSAAATNKSKIPVFGGKSTPGTPPSLFGSGANTQPFGSVFGGKGLLAEKASPVNSVFGSDSSTPSSCTAAAAPVTFGAKPTPQSLFGGAGARGSSVFGGSAPPQQQTAAAAEDDVVFISESRPSEELVRKAKEFLLPSGHYLYEHRKPCKGCIGCEQNEDAILDHLFYNKPYAKNGGLSPLVKNTTRHIRQEPADISGFAAYTSAEDFSSLSAVSNNPNAFQKSEGFKWSGAGKTLFGGGSSGGRSKSEENPEAFEAETDFRPVLDVLPDLVETRTGEEDEERLFCHRAKLFRFDADQWKERGIGEMKLLKHHENGTVRVLLRREQVLKLVCNHQVQPEMDLKPLATSETAWCWVATDYSDNSTENKVEQFAVRFKNIDLAKEFKQKFEEAKEFVKLSREARPSKDSEDSPTGADGHNDCVPEGAEASSGAAYGGDEEDYDDDDSDEGIKILFERQVTLLEKQGSVYQPMGLKQIQVVEETMDILGGIAIYVNDLKDGHLEYRQLIFQETEPVNLQKTTCVWQMHDFLSDRPSLKRFQAKFSSGAAANEFANHIIEGISYAKTMKLSEMEAIRSSMTTNPTEIDLSGATVSGDGAK